MTSYASKNNQLRSFKHYAIATCYPESNQAGLEVIRNRGNAADAFVASTFVDYVVASGTTSMAGPINILAYDPAIGTRHLSAELKTVSDAKGLWSSTTDPPGKSVLIPGAIAGLWALHKRFGKLPWEYLLAYAIELAEAGFAISTSYSLILESRKLILRQSEYARKLYFKNGELLKEGETLKQPELAYTLKGIRQDNINYFYKGKWAQEFVNKINSIGGCIKLEDLSNYKAIWVQPLKSTYKGYDIYTCNYRSYGGIKLLLALKILEQIDMQKIGHWYENIDALELMMLIYKTINAENWFYYPHFLDNRHYIRDKISPKYAKVLLNKLTETKRYIPYKPSSNSSHVITKDSEGMIVSGTNTISSIPWGDNAIYVGGVPLNDFGYTTLGISLKQFVPSASSIEFVFENNNLILASGFFSASMFPADFQVLANILDFHMDVQSALSAPRFGGVFVDFTKQPLIVDSNYNFIDIRFPPSFISSLKERGINVINQGYTDTGIGVLMQIDYNNNLIYGAISEQIGGVINGA